MARANEKVDETVVKDIESTPSVEAAPVDQPDDNTPPVDAVVPTVAADQPRERRTRILMGTIPANEQFNAHAIADAWLAENPGFERYDLHVESYPHGDETAYRIIVYYRLPVGVK
jgi:hypothetical protein